MMSNGIMWDGIEWKGEKECCICGNPARYANSYKGECLFDEYDCGICGRFSIIDSEIDKDMFAPYLFYKSRMLPPMLGMKRSLFIATGENIEKVREKLSSVVLVTDTGVDIWYPRTFSTKIDAILLGLSGLSKYNGSYILLNEEEIYSAFFVERYGENKNKKRPKTEMDAQVSFIFKYLTVNRLMETHDKNGIMILPDGLKRIDELQKNQSNTKNAFVAMSFAEKMNGIRKAIIAVLLEKRLKIKVF